MHTRYVPLLVASLLTVAAVASATTVPLPGASGSPTVPGVTVTVPAVSVGPACSVDLCTEDTTVTTPPVHLEPQCAPANIICTSDFFLGPQDVIPASALCDFIISPPVRQLACDETVSQGPFSEKVSDNITVEYELQSGSATVDQGNGEIPPTPVTIPGIGPVPPFTVTLCASGCPVPAASGNVVTGFFVTVYFDGVPQGGANVPINEDF